MTSRKSLIASAILAVLVLAYGARAQQALPPFDPSQPYTVASNSCNEPSSFVRAITCYADAIANSVLDSDDPYADILSEEARELRNLAVALDNRQVTEAYARQRVVDLSEQTRQKLKRRRDELVAHIHSQNDADQQYLMQQETLEAAREARDAARQAEDDMQLRAAPSWPTYCQRYDRDSMYCY